MKKPTLPVFIEVLKTLAEQSFIDVEPTERNYDLTPIYDFLVTSKIASAPYSPEKYWLILENEDACIMLANLLAKLSKT